MRTPIALTLAATTLAACALAAPGGGAPLELTELHRGPHCGRSDPQPALSVVQHGEALRALWQRIGGATLPRPKAPAIDFTRSVVVVVELGARSHGGDGLERSAATATLIDGVARLPVEIHAAPADAMVSTVLSSPCAVYALPRAGVSRVTALGLSVALQPD